MTKMIKREVNRPLNSNNPRDREIFREKLIEKLKSSTYVKTFTQKQFDELIENLTWTRFFRTAHLNHKIRQNKVENVAVAAKNLFQRIEALDISEKSIFDDEMQHTTPLIKMINAIKSLKLKADEVANLIPPEKHNDSTDLRHLLNGQILTDILNRFSIPITPCHEIPSKKESTIFDQINQTKTIYLPDLSINATSAMLCAMFILLEGDEEVLYWQDTITIIDSANNEAKDFKDKLDKLVKSDNFIGKCSRLIREIINNPQ